MNIRIKTEERIAVDHDYYIRSMVDCPRGVKVILVTVHGVACFGIYDGKDKQWIGWAPLPKIPRHLRPAEDDGLGF